MEIPPAYYDECKGAEKMHWYQRHAYCRREAFNKLSTTILIYFIHIDDEDK